MFKGAIGGFSFMNLCLVSLITEIDITDVTFLNNMIDAHYGAFPTSSILVFFGEFMLNFRSNSNYYNLSYINKKVMSVLKVII